MDPTNRVAVITGATGGLGRVGARRFGQAGARLALFSSSEENLNKLAEELAFPNENCLIRALNFRHPDAAEAAAQATLDKFGRFVPHFLANRWGRIVIISISEWGAYPSIRRPVVPHGK